MHFIMGVLHVVALFVFFPALFFTIPMHILLSVLVPKRTYEGKEVNVKDIAVG